MTDAFEAALEAEGQPAAARTITVRGREWELADELSSMAVISFARVAAAGADSAGVAGMAALHRLLEAALAPGLMPAFEDFCISQRVTDEELLVIVRGLISGETARPTGRPSSSSAGQPLTTTTSRDDFSSPDVSRPAAFRDDPRLQPDQMVPADRALQLLAG